MKASNNGVIHLGIVIIVGITIAILAASAVPNSPFKDKLSQIIPLTTPAPILMPA